MRPILTDRVAWSVGLSVGLSHYSEPCKNGCTDRAAVWVEDLGGPGEPRIIVMAPDPPFEGANFVGENGRPIVKYRDTTVVCAKTAEQIGMPFGLWSRMGRRNHVLAGGP